jgi:thioredoxin 1
MSGKPYQSWRLSHGMTYCIMKSKFQELINGDTPTLVDFSAEWCGPCKMMAPILEEFKSQVGDKVKVIKIDVDRNPAIASSYQINSVPTLMLFKAGQMVWRQAGVMQTSQLMKLVESY